MVTSEAVVSLQLPFFRENRHLLWLPGQHQGDTTWAHSAGAHHLLQRYLQSHRTFGLCENWSQLRPSWLHSVWSTRLSICPPQLPSAVIFSCRTHCHPPTKSCYIPWTSLSKTPYVQRWHVFIWTKPLLERACTAPGLHTVPRLSTAWCIGPKLPLSLARACLSAPCLDVATSPRAEWAKIPIAHHLELSEPGLLCAQWRTAFGYNF